MNSRFRAVFSALLVFFCFTSKSFAAESASLSEVMESERQLLMSQKNRLVERRDMQAAELERKLKAEMIEVERLQRELEQTSSRLKDLSESADDSVSGTEGESPEAIYQSTYAQMVSSLKNVSGTYGTSEGTEALDMQRVGQKHIVDGFRKALESLRASFGIHSRKGEFFDGGGKKVSGSIWEIGSIAAYGEADGARGALIPAGGGMFKLSNLPVGSAVSVVKGSEKSDVITVFLFESREKAMETRKDKGLRETLSGGGPVAYVLVLLGVVTACLIALKAWNLSQASRHADSIIVHVADLVRRGEMGSALQFCRSHKGAYARVIEATVSGLGKSRKALEDAIGEVIIREGTLVDRFGSIIVVIAAAAPLLGLLGTVSGMIHTFEVITEFGDNDPKLLSSGISEALIDTMLGLVVAIPALLFGNLLSNWVERVKDGLEKASLHLLTADAERVLQEESRV